MEEKKFAPYCIEIEFPIKVIQAIRDFNEGKSIDPNGFSYKEINDIGLCFWYGYIVERNYEEAVLWYKESAKGNYPAAEFNLYVCYDRGSGVAKDRSAAMFWLKRAAKHGYRNAQFCLAESYYNGEGLRRNRRFARIWFEKAEKTAIEKNDEIILNLFGITYLHGENGMEKDIDKALFFYEKAGMLHFPLSISTLISLYIKMGNVEKVEFWKKEFDNCKTKTKLSTESVERAYKDFIEKSRTHNSI